MEHANQNLGTERIGKLMRQYAIPCIISLLVGALYNIVDQIFIANASYLGSYGNAANTVVFPLTVVALAIAVMIGDGCCAFVSISLGKQETAAAKQSVGSSVMMTVISGLVLTAVYLLFSEQIIAMFGGTVNAETFRHSREYFFYITLGIPFYMATSKNYFLMVWARDFVLTKVLKIPEYFVYCGVFKMNCQGKRSVQTAKGWFLEAPMCSGKP